MERTICFAMVSFHVSICAFARLLLALTKAIPVASMRPCPRVWNLLGCAAQTPAAWL